MISDEMRELLSTYVDGELRDSDAARVEEMSKRDPELHREIAAYRILSRQLKAWDEAENALDVPPEVEQRALSRAEAYVALEAPRRPWYTGWVAAAAGLLVAVSLGAVLSRDTQAPARITIANALSGADVAVDPGSAGEAAVSVVDLKDPAPLPQFQPLHPVFKEGLRGWMVDGRVWTRESRQFLIDWTEQRDQLRRWHVLNPVKPETQTGSGWRPEIMALVRGYEPGGVPLGGLVMFRHNVAVSVASVRAMPLGGRAEEYPTLSDAFRIDPPRTSNWLVLAGEIFVGENDRSNRVRIVSASSWVVPSAFVPMVAGDTVALPRNSRYLTLQRAMLGPKARRALVGGQAPSLTGSALPKANERDVKKLVDALRADVGATGFAVVAGENVMGVELFATHELMMAFAPRLLRGYVNEAGPKSISLQAPTRGTDALAERARKVLDGVAGGAQRLVDLEHRQDGWDKKLKLRRVNIMAGRKIVGHGLLIKKRPLHVTLFVD